MDDEDTPTGLRVGQLYNLLARTMNTQKVAHAEGLAAITMLFVTTWTENRLDSMGDADDLLEYLDNVMELMRDAVFEQDGDPDLLTTDIFGFGGGGEA